MVEITVLSRVELTMIDISLIRLYQSISIGYYQDSIAACKSVGIRSEAI